MPHLPLPTRLARVLLCCLPWIPHRAPSSPVPPDSSARHWWPTYATGGMVLSVQNAQRIDPVHPRVSMVPVLSVPTERDS